MTPMTDKAEALADNLLRYDSLETFAVTQEIQKALEEAYNQGYADGHQKGDAKGYTDGAGVP